MNAKTLEAVIRHGNSLLAVFTECTEKDPVVLCKKLRRIEAQATQVSERLCNGEIAQDGADVRYRAIAKRLGLLLVPSHSLAADMIHINRDPRGYALKLDDEWTREWNKTAAIPIQTDWGQYGILAPDLTTK